MYKYVFKIVLLGITCLIASALNAQACDLSLESVSQIRFESYSSVSRTTQPQKIPLRLRNDGDEACKGFISVKAIDGDGHLLGLSGERMSYALFSGRDSSHILFQSGLSVQNQLPILIQAENSRIVDFYLVIDRLQNLSAGTYMTDLEMNFETANRNIFEAMTIRIGANIDPSLQANFTGIGGIITSEKSFNPKSSRSKAVLDLGELTPNETRRLGLQIRANSPVAIKVSSENSGVLQHEYEEGEIPYSVRLNRHDLDLTAISVLSGQVSPKKNGLTNSLTIKLSDFGKNVPAGHYSDVLTFRISAR